MLRQVFVLPTRGDSARLGASTIADRGASDDGWQPVQGQDPQAPADIP